MRRALFIVKVSTESDWPLLRQTPGGDGVWGNCRFVLNQQVSECDYWVVHDGLSRSERTVCPPENTILITCEPPAVKTYDTAFLNQFATVITCDRTAAHPNLILSQQSLPWHVGREVRGNESVGFTKSYDELCRMEAIPKDKVISVISSIKQFTTGHAQRLEFTRQLAERLGCRIDVFGRGIRDIADKWDGIARYKYHVVIENCQHSDYWTEKLSDAYLGGAYPFYYGCPNLSDYFSTGAFTPINIEDIDGTIEVIEHAVATRQYERAVGEISTAREQVLNAYNLFPAIHAHIASRGASGKRRTVVLRPESGQESRNERLRTGFQRVKAYLLRSTQS